MDQPLLTSDTVDLARVARLVRPFETLETRAVRRPGGGWSIGYGHVRSAREGAEVTVEEAEALLIYDLRDVASVVRSAIYAPIHRNQLEALIAFAFHIGADSFLRSTTLHRFNAGDSLGAAQDMERWCRADLDGKAQVVDALVRRRAAEKAHFLTPPGGFPKSSRARVRPRFEALAEEPVAEPTDASSSAAMAAADNVSARLRALVPDVADQAEFRPSSFESEPEIGPEPQPAPWPEPVERVAPPARLDPEPAVIAPMAAAAPVLYEAFAAPEAEIPPPPMPFEVARGAPKSESALHEVWPSIRPAEVRADDPFAQGPLEAASIDAPPLDYAAPISSLFRGRVEHRVQIPPRSEQVRDAQSPRASWEGVPKSWLWAFIAVGLLIFSWAIWSIFMTNPGPINFLAGLGGIAVMAIPAYLLLGGKRE